MRRCIGILVLAVLVVAAGASAATAPYTATRTAACLRAQGKRVETKDISVTLDFPEIRTQIYWNFGTYVDQYGVLILFTSSSANAHHLLARLSRMAYAMGAEKSEIPKVIGQKGNVVWEYDASLRGLPATQAALLRRCIR